jgi:hypothetical protein
MTDLVCLFLQTGLQWCWEVIRIIKTDGPRLLVPPEGLDPVLWIEKHWRF